MLEICNGEQPGRIELRILNSSFGDLGVVWSCRTGAIHAASETPDVSITVTSHP
jgi:hypothetical protein